MHPNQPLNTYLYFDDDFDAATKEERIIKMFIGNPQGHERDLSKDDG